MNSLSSKLISTPILNGAILATVGILMYNGLGSSVTLAGVNIPAPIIDFALGAAASFGADLATDYVLPQVTKDEKVKLLEARIMNPVVAGALLVGLQSAVIRGALPVDSSSLFRGFLLGAGSELGALYSYDIVKGLFKPAL